MSGNNDSLVAEWVSFVTNPKYSLVEKCFKLAQLLEYPDLNIQDYVEKINEIGKSLKTSVTNEKSPTFKISMLNEHLYQNCGYGGDENDYYDPKNNFLNAVIDKKTGIPITLGILYAEVAKHIGLDIRIAGFPSHILVKYNEEMILDPFYEGQLLESDDLQDILDANYGGQVMFVPEYLNEITPEKLLIRMARNLKNSYAQSYAYDNAMKCIDMVLALEPDTPEDIRDKGVLEERLTHYDSSLKNLNRYLELSPDAEDVDFVLELIKNIRNKTSQ